MKSIIQKIITTLILIPITFLIIGSDCEQARIESFDKGRMKIDDVELVPFGYPFHVVADSMNFDNIHVLSEVIDYINQSAQFTLFTLSTDHQLFRLMEIAEPEDRIGTVLFWIGSLPTEGWYEDEPQEGGRATLYFDEMGFIVYADVAIDHDHAYHEETVRKRSIHELGHVLGLAHDGNSIDLNSCMTSPPIDGCILTEHDIHLIRTTHTH